MALLSNANSEQSLFSKENSFNVNKLSSETFYDIIRSLNIIDPESLSKDEISNILSRIDSYNGFFTTQQLENINYNNFNEHVFFDSAVSKVIYAFDRIHNIPFDSDEVETLKYLNKNDGYTAHILKNIFPKKIGYAIFDGSHKVVVYDEQGKVVKSDTKKVGLLNPQNKRFSFDFWINPSSLSNDNNQIIFKKFENSNNKNGFICFLSNNDLATKYINFIIYIDNKYCWAKTLINTEDEKFKNIVISVTSNSGFKKINFLINGNLVEQRDILRSNHNLKNKSFNESFMLRNIPLVIGGHFNINSEMQVANNFSLDIDNEVINFNNFIGSIDEFRFFHKVRSSKNIKKEMHKNIFSQRDLQFYARFNEPGGDYQNSFLIIDYSGNKLYGVVYKYSNVTNRHEVLTDTTDFKSIDNQTPLKLEKAIDSPVLNSSFSKTKLIREKLINTAKNFDDNNPNLIFNLLPKHYFINSSDFQRLPVFSNDSPYNEGSSLFNEDGSIKNPVSLSPEISANNDLVNIVLIWARFFDQLKAYISSITNILNVDYDTSNKQSIVGMQIPLLCKMYGIKFKEILPSPTKNKLNSENLVFDDIVSEYSIRKIQNILWHRFLINTNDFLKSKGTRRSVETVFNSFGIDYTKLIDIKEFSSYNESVSNNFFNLKKNVSYIDFGNKKELMTDPVYLNPLVDAMSENKLYLEVPNIKSQTGDVKNSLISNFINGLNLDWTIEVFLNFNESIEKYRYKNITSREQISYKKKQNILRLNTDGDASLLLSYEKNNDYHSQKGSLILNVQPIKNNPSFNVEISINDINIFNTPKYINIKQKANIEENSLTYELTFDEIGKQNNLIQKNKIIKKVENIKIVDALGNTIKNLSEISNVNNNINEENNLSFYRNNLDLNIGSYNYNSNNMLSSLLSEADDTNFQGQIICLRLWNKSIDDIDENSHIKDIDNIGIKNTYNQQNLVFNYMFKKHEYYLENNINKWSFKDYTGNVSALDKNHLNSCNVLLKDISRRDNDFIFYMPVIFKATNNKIDEPVKENRVNIISYKDNKNKLLTNNKNSFPSNTIPIDYKHENKNRVSVDMSITKVVNNDISNLISDMSSFVKKINSKNSQYDYEYLEINNIRMKYFEKYKDNELIDYSSLMSIYKYFDNIMSSILYDIVPSKINFQGFNYVYESHILERHKYQYKNSHSNTPIVDLRDFTSFSRNKENFRRNISYNINRNMK